MQRRYDFPVEGITEQDGEDAAPNWRAEDGAELTDELLQRKYGRLLESDALEEGKGQVDLLVGQLETSSEQCRAVGRD